MVESLVHPVGVGWTWVTGGWTGLDWINTGGVYSTDNSH